MGELPLNLGSLDLPQLELLQSEGLRESRSLDFKRELCFESDSQKREILSDITSFANAVGGDLVFGVDEDPSERGLMGAIVGIKSDYDRTVQKLTESLQRGVNPRVPDLRFHRIPVSEDRFVLIVRIPRSRIAPHMVTHSELFRIHGRSSSGKLTLSVQEIRDLVLSTESIAERMRRYRLGRASDITGGDGPIPVADGATAMVHLMPHAAFGEPRHLGVRPISWAMQSASLLPLGAGGQRAFPVYEGVVLPSGYECSEAYAMVTNEGVAEGVHVGIGYVSSDNRYMSKGVEHNFIRDDWLSHQVVFFLHQAQRVLTGLGMPLPMQVSIVLTGVKDHYISPERPNQVSKPITRDVLDLGTTEIDRELDQDAWASAIQPLFDRLANAGGHWRSSLWSEDGKLRRPLNW